MKHVLEHTPNANRSTSSWKDAEKTTVTSTTSAIIDASMVRVGRLFKRFAAIYGHVWASQFRDDEFLKITKKAWANTLAEFDDVVMNRAVGHCIKRFELPPNLPQFFNLCRSLKPYQAPSKNHQEFKKNIPLAKKHIAIMRQLLK